MPRNETYPGVLKTPYSKWHRSKHNGICYSDIDKIAQCPACGKGLFLADLVFNKNDTYRSKSWFTQQIYRQISAALDIPFFELFYTTKDRKDDGDLVRLAARRITPTKGELIHLSLDEWLQFLEFKVQQHIPECERRKYLYQRVTEENEHNKNFTRKNNYVKILLNRS